MPRYPSGGESIQFCVFCVFQILENTARELAIGAGPTESPNAIREGGKPKCLYGKAPPAPTTPGGESVGILNRRAVMTMLYRICISIGKADSVKSTVRHLMNPTDAMILLVAGVPIGLLLVAALKEATEELRRIIASWALLFGGVAVMVVGAVLVGLIQPTQTKQFLGIVFVGLPAFGAGAVLRLANWRRKESAK